MKQMLHIKVHHKSVILHNLQNFTREATAIYLPTKRSVGSSPTPGKEIRGKG